MASLSNERNGTRRIQWFDENGDRKTLRLSKTSIKAAKSFKLQLERLIAAQRTGTPLDAQTAQWLNDLPEPSYAKLAGHGLAEPRTARIEYSLGMLIEKCLATKSIKPSTVIRYSQCRDLLNSYFGADRKIESISNLDADQWRAWLVSKGYALAKVSKEVQIARMFFRQACKWKLIAENPFEGVRTGSQISPERKPYVTVETTLKLIQACPNDDWRCIIALARFAGLRCPSEVLAVRWEDVDWDTHQLRIRSKKTEHHPGKAQRTAPIVPELFRILRDAFERAPVGAERVVNGYAADTMNLGTNLARIVKRAGVEPWPKAFSALRASRSVEIRDQFSDFHRTEWMGHTKLVAEHHYDMVRPDDLDRAINTPLLEKRGAECGALVVQNAAQHPTASNCKKGYSEAQIEKGPAFMPIPSECCDSLHIESMGRGGLEPPTPAFSMPCSTN